MLLDAQSIVGSRSAGFKYLDFSLHSSTIASVVVREKAGTTNRSRNPYAYALAFVVSPSKSVHPALEMSYHTSIFIGIGSCCV